MADSAVAVTAGTGTNIDTRTEGTNGNHRQVVVLGDPATNAGVAPVDATNGLSVTLTTALPAGTAAIGKLAANSGVDIGDVDILSIAAGDNNIGNVDVVTMPVTHVIIDSGNPTSITANAGTNLNTSALATESGGNLAAAATSLAIIDDWDASDHCNIRHLNSTDDTVNAVVTNAGTFATQAEPTIKTGYIQGKVDNADTTTAREVIAATTGSKKVYITSFIISVAAAGNYWLEDGDAAQITPKFYLAANGGVSFTATQSCPYVTTTADKAIKVKGSTAGAVGCMVVGYAV